jgi:hypothetical protein
LWWITPRKQGEIHHDRTVYHVNPQVMVRSRHTDHRTHARHRPTVEHTLPWPEGHPRGSRLFILLGGQALAEAGQDGIGDEPAHVAAILRDFPHQA